MLRHVSDAVRFHYTSKSHREYREAHGWPPPVTGPPGARAQQPAAEPASEPVAVGGGAAAAEEPSSSSPPPPTAPPTALPSALPSWISEDARVEVRMEEEGLVGSHYPGRVVGVEGSRAFIEFASFFSDEGGEHPLQDWVEIAQLWPVPPPPPPDFFDRLAEGEPLEVFHEEGWWEVRLRASCLGEGGVRTFQVVSPEYQSERWAPPCELRPLWRFVREGHWQAVAPRDLNVFEELMQPAAPPAQPSAAAAAPAAQLTSGAAEYTNGAAEEYAAAATAATPKARKEANVVAPPHAEARHPSSPAKHAARMQASPPTGRQRAPSRGGGGGKPVAAAAGKAAATANGTASVSEQLDELRGRHAALYEAAREYETLLEELRAAANSLFPLANGAVVTAGGTLAKPAALMKELPPLPAPYPPPPAAWDGAD